MESLRRQATAEQNQLRQILNSDRGPTPDTGRDEDFEREMRRLQKDLDPEDPLSKNRAMRRLQWDLDPEDPLYPAYGIRNVHADSDEEFEREMRQLQADLDPEDPLARRRKW
jgi:hypothetical protein